MKHPNLIGDLQAQITSLEAHALEHRKAIQQLMDKLNVIREQQERLKDVITILREIE